MMSAAVDLLIVQSLAGSGVILLTLLVRRAWSHRVSARFMYALWLLAAIRLALPLELPGVALGGYCNGDMYECTARQVTLVEQSEAGTAMRNDDRANAAQPLDASLYGSNCYVCCTRDRTARQERA